MNRPEKTRRPIGVLLCALAIACAPMSVACGGPIPVGTSQTGGAGASNPNGAGGVILSFPVGGTGGGDTGAGNSTTCDNKILVVLRDFRGCTDAQGPRHPDFEQGNNVPDKGIVGTSLGSDRKPVYAHGSSRTQTVQSADTFNQWYRDADGVNQRIESSLTLTPSAADPSVKIYESTAFFPIDGQGWGNQQCQGGQHNYAFTTEIHTTFTYKGGESFTFRGDDDVFAFVNNKQVIDLGGIHQAQTGTVNMDAQADALGIVKGQTYPMDIFHAERHVIYSNFRMETRFECLTSIIIP
jgi:fibro-slime domain-containing protein